MQSSSGMGRLAPRQGVPGIEVQQDGEQRGHDGDAAAHEGDVLKRRQQLCRDRGRGQLLWEGRGAAGPKHGGALPDSVRGTTQPQLPFPHQLNPVLD